LQHHDRTALLNFGDCHPLFDTQRKAQIVRQAKERNSAVNLDAEFGKDLERIIAAHDQPWNPPSWE
jgi:hypothetical protein